MAGGRPTILDHIELKMKGASARNVLQLGCGLGSKCAKPVVGALQLAYSDGRHNIYLGCSDHLKELEQRHPRLLGARQPQTFFYF